MTLKGTTVVLISAMAVARPAGTAVAQPAGAGQVSRTSDSPERQRLLNEVIRLRELPAWKELDLALARQDEAGFIGVLEKEPRLIRFYRGDHGAGLYPMLIAIDHNWARLLEFLLAQGESPDGRTDPLVSGTEDYVSLGFPAARPLQLAASLYRAQMVAKLLAAGAALEGTNRGEIKPLTLAVNWPMVGYRTQATRPRQSSEADRIETVLLLLRHGANPFEATSRVFYTGSSPPTARDLTDLIITNARSMDVRSPEGDTLLHWAAKAGAVDSVDVLLGRGMKPDATNQAGRTPLHLVAALPKPDEAEIGRLSHFDSWMSIARSLTNRTRIARRLTAAGARHDVFSAAGLGDTNALTSLLDKDRTLLNSRDRRGDTAMHWAAAAGELSTLRVLIVRGADPSVTNNSGNTPLHRTLGAEKAGFASPEVVKMLDLVAALLSARAPLEVVNREGLTPLATAVSFWNKESMEQLLAAGARVNPTNFGARAPLHAAAESGDNEMMDYLLDHGADPQTRDTQGRPILHILFGGGPELQAIEHLVRDRRFDINARDLNGNTILHLAVADPGEETRYEPPPNPLQRLGEKYETVADLLEMLEKKGIMEATPSGTNVLAVPFLLKLGANPKATNSLGETPLHLVGEPKDSSDDPDTDLSAAVADSSSSEANAPSSEVNEDDDDLEAAKVAAKLLLKAGARISARDHNGETVLGRALRLKRPKWAAILRELGAKE